MKKVISTLFLIFLGFTIIAQTSENQKGNDASNYWLQGLRYKILGEYELSLENLNKAIQLDPKMVDAYIDRAEVCIKLRLLDIALNSIEQAIIYDNNNKRIFYVRGLYYEAIEDYITALKDFNKAIELNPNDYLAFYERGNSKSNLGDLRGAIQDYTKVLELSPNYWNAYYNRGCVRMDLKDYSGSIQDFNKVLEYNKDFASVYFNRGLSKIACGEIDSGCLDLSKAGEMGLSDAYDIIRKYCN